MAKQYKYEVQVSRGWGGVEEIRIATGTDSPDELKGLVNTVAESMQDRANWHQDQLKKAEEITRKAIAQAQAEEASANKKSKN